jgi:hypothetical protein
MKQPEDSPTTAYRWTAAAGSSSIRLMLRDSDFAVAYWELSGADAFEARQRLEPFDRGGALVLRMRSWREGSPARTWDIATEGWIDSRYVPLADPDAYHQATLGMRAANGTLVPVVRSNVIYLGRAGREERVRWSDAPPRAVEGQPLPALEDHEDSD